MTGLTLAENAKSGLDLLDEFGAVVLLCKPGFRLVEVLLDLGIPGRVQTAKIKIFRTNECSDFRTRPRCRRR